MMCGITLKDGAPNLFPRTRDRTLATGILVSVGIHALLIVAIIAASARTGSDATLRKDGQGAGVEVTLMSFSAPAAPAASPMPSPKGDTAASSASVRRVAGEAASASASEPRPSESGTAASAASQLASVSGTGSSISAAQSPSSSDPGAGDDYRRRLLEHIAAYRRSPAPAAGAAPNGMVMVRFSLTRSGDVQMVVVAHSSGFPDLDQAAVDTIWRAGPMPSIPLALPERLFVVLPVAFGPVNRLTG